MISMKKILITILALLFISMNVNANELESKLNKVYDKGSKVAENYISNFLNGPGDTEVSLLRRNNNKPTGSIMIVRPYSFDENSVLFYQAQINSYAVEGDARQSLNYGVGKRFLSDNKSNFWGINTFVDLDIRSNSRLGFGSEFKTSAFNINGNYYVDVLGADEKGNSVGKNTERVLDGYDLNISGQVPYAPWANINYNDYTWKANKAAKDSKGKIYSGIFDLSNNLTIELGRDDNNINEYSNFAKLIYVHGTKKRQSAEDGLSSTAFQNSDVSKDMLTKIKRSNIITLEIENTGVVIVNGN
tara:strand:+ start:88 stop:993 length:906 start_codon:yes stop_codon:yes gene_type:complete